MAEADADKVCFVVMGFGKKTDYETGRTLDLNATYEAIIKPAVVEAGLRCVRADEVVHSGVIDLPMYQMLLTADLVIADISTANANALYELGVRHALRPYATIIMKEVDGRFHFDLNHIATVMYKHLGEDIGVSEANKIRPQLVTLIKEVMQTAKPDSPVYTFLTKLVQPRLSPEEIERRVAQIEARQEELAAQAQQGEAAMAASRPCDAAKGFRAALGLAEGPVDPTKLEGKDPYLVQRLALATYKCQRPDEVAALQEALRILSALDPESSNDPETLGLSGAVQKRLWLATRQPEHLAAAIRHYGRGFEVRKDYYNGENYAQCLTDRAALQDDPEERLFDRISARKVREQLLQICRDIIASGSFEERSDVKWVYATAANVAFALGHEEEGRFFEARFGASKPADWEVESYRKNLAEMLRLARS
jgi:hypothetical protein